jgi:sulfate transport system permease protein
MTITPRTRWSLRAIALLYLLLLLLLPVVVVFFKTFEHGWSVAWGYMTTPAAISALWLSLLMAAIAVPLNTIFARRRCSTRSSTCRSSSRRSSSAWR